MNNRYWLRAITTLAICFLLAFTASARSRGQKRESPEACKDNVRMCLRNIEAQISQSSAYVRHVKPGDPVMFNPQPDPPGDPDPWYRHALADYKNLQMEIPNLSESSPWGRSKWTWSQEKIKVWQSAASEAQDKLNRLGEASDRRSANAALNELSAAVQRLSRMLVSSL